MNTKPQIYMGFLKSVIVISGIFLFAFQGFAGVSNIYKWKDDQGKVHFTDNPLKIPSRYRSPARVEKRRALPPPKLSPIPSPDSPEKEGAADDLNKQVEEDEQAVMQDALSFLKNDIQRYKKYEDYVPQKRHAVLLRNDIVEVLPEKEALEKKLEKFDSALLKDIRSFLKKSLQKDYEAKNREHPRRLVFIKERSRINGELPEKNTLTEKLEVELAALSEHDPAQSKHAPSDFGSKKRGMKNPGLGKEKAGQSGPEKY